MKLDNINVTTLDKPIPLGCGYWHSNSSKCAETATVRLECDGEEALSCPHHQELLTASLASDEEA